MGPPANDNQHYRRVHVEHVRIGPIALPEREAHHLRDVLRMTTGDIVELFDDAGRTARAEITGCGPSRVEATVTEVQGASDDRAPSATIVVAAAVPKGDRAEWMIEKLSELGVSRFIPLAAARSVVLPEGRNKRERWTRIATEAAKQSRRSGVMIVEPLTKFDDVLRAASKMTGFILSTEPGAAPLSRIIHERAADVKTPVLLLVGPEGGWTNEELAGCAAAGLTPARLTATILRVETAAVAAAAVVAAGLVAQAPIQRST